MKEIENHNTLVFIVSRRANKPQVCYCGKGGGRTSAPLNRGATLATTQSSIYRLWHMAHVVLNILHHHPHTRRLSWPSRSCTT